MNDLLEVLAPCGVYCGACPSFQKSCLGCSPESKDQSRTSKWGCKIRRCCYGNKGLEFCADCTEFPCKKITKKLIESHLNDPKYEYRHEIPENVKMFKFLGQKEYLKYQEQKWSCPVCGGRVTFYNYQCQECGKKIM
jgi:hypothetical protein